VVFGRRGPPLDRVGCFEYSPVEGAAANDLREAVVPDEVKAERRARFMELSAEISAARRAQKVGRSMQVLIDRMDGNTAVARSASDAPEIDGTVRIANAKGVTAGSLVQVKITAAGAYDLEAKLIQS
jgi:ribosomal protein S12 methylthiotransferase